MSVKDQCLAAAAGEGARVAKPLQERTTAIQEVAGFVHAVEVHAELAKRRVSNGKARDERAIYAHQQLIAPEPEVDRCVDQLRN